jgi:hypothetical protein
MATINTKIEILKKISRLSAKNIYSPELTVMELPCGAALVDYITCVAHAHIIKTFPLHNL